MSPKKQTVRNGAFMGAAIVLAGVVIANDKVVTLAEVPDAVKATISQKAPGATPSEIELEDENGKQIYSVKFKQGNKERELEIATDGTFIKEDVEEADNNDDDKATSESAKSEKEEDDDEEVIDPASAPDAVKKALVSILNGAPIKKLSKESNDGTIEYEVEFERDGKKHSANFTADGTVKELESALAIDALPAPVASALKTAHPSAKIKEAEESIKNPGDSAVHHYEVKIDEAGKTSEVIIDASGKIIPSQKLENQEDKD